MMKKIIISVVKDSDDDDDAPSSEDVTENDKVNHDVLFETTSAKQTPSAVALDISAKYVACLVPKDILLIAVGFRFVLRLMQRSSLQ